MTRPVFHSPSVCAGCDVTGDEFYSVNVEAFELTGELYCDDCSEAAIAQWAEDNEDDGSCPGCGACPGFTGVECDGDCDWAQSEAAQ